MKRASVTAVICMAVLLATGRAWAVPPQTCTLSTSPINFGNYSYLSAADLLFSGPAISLQCDRGVARLEVSMGPGSGTSGFNPRQMTGPTVGDLMNYNLYRDAGGTEIWGDGSPGTFTVLVQNNWQQVPVVNLNVYGRVPQGQLLRVGVYRDTVTVTIMW
jgi:spore coat protein U-like protein